MALVVKNLPAREGEIRNAGSIPGSERSHGGRQGNPLQYSCLESPMDRGAWWAVVHRVAKIRTRQKQQHARMRITTKGRTYGLSKEGQSPRPHAVWSLCQTFVDLNEEIN